MSILDRIVELLGEQDQKKLTDYLHLKKSAFTDWKSGKSNSYRKYLIEISEFFGVSIDYLVYGNDAPVQNITNSAIGAMGEHSTGTVNIQNSSESEDELAKELAKILKSLPLKERSKLLNMIYDFEESYKKENGGLIIDVWKKKLTAFDADYINNLLKQVHESETIVQSNN